MLRLRTVTGAGTTISNTDVTLSGTNDWTLLEATYTTESTARYIAPLVYLNAGNIASLNVDDIQLYPTTAITRSAATGRLAATGRSAA